MSELAVREQSNLVAYVEDPTGGRLVAWAQAASAANQLAKALTTTTFVPAAFKGNPADATAAILMGDELGLSPLAALRSISVVHGAPAMYARTMVALAQAHGHDVWTEKSTETEVTVCGQRKGSDHIEKATWTIKRAQTAGYTSNKKYQSNPQEMLYAKAAAEVARKVAADVLAGVPYSVEDLELEEPAPTTTVSRARRAAPLTAVPEPEPDLEPTAPPADPITDAQMKKLHACFGDLEVTDRDMRLAFASEFIGHDIASSKELTKDEATRLIDHIETGVLNRQKAKDEEALLGDGA